MRGTFMGRQNSARIVGGYDEYYGFQHSPFSLTPDPGFVYPSASHTRALQIITHSLARREGLILVTGDIGCGKTTLCRRLVGLLPPRTFLSVILNPFLSAEDLLKQILEDFGLVSASDVRVGTLRHATCFGLARTLEEFLASLADLGASAVIILDEAQNLPLKTLEQVRLLSNFETTTAKQLQIILVGQMNLGPILALPEMRQLSQRISRRITLEPLSSPEVAAYIEWRLKIAQGFSPRPREGQECSVSTPNDAETSGLAGSPSVRFTPNALSAVRRVSVGVPRVINLVCDRALEIARFCQTASISSRLVMGAVRDLGLPTSRTGLFAGWRAKASLFLVAVVIVAGAFTFWVVRARTSSTSLFRVSSPPVSPALPEPKEVTVQGQGALASAAPVDSAQGAAAGLASGTGTTLETLPSFELLAASFQTASRAENVASELRMAGYPARAVESGGWQAVFVGPYGSLTEAEAARQALTALGFGGARVLPPR